MKHCGHTPRQCVHVHCGSAHASAVFIYPALYQAVPALAASPRLMGIYTGSTVHELAGVVAAGNAMGAEVASTSVITKRPPRTRLERGGFGRGHGSTGRSRRSRRARAVLRVFLLEPWIIAIYYLGIGQDKADATKAKAGKGVPWFAFGFIGVAAYNSIFGIPLALQKKITMLSAGFLASAMAALGLDTDLVKVKSLGWKPIALAMALWANLLGMGFLVSKALVGAL